MAQSPRITNKLPSFARSLYNVLDDALKEAAKDTLINAKSKAPFDKGGLRSESEIENVKPLHKRVSFWKEYARFQEFGGDSKRRVRNYSHSGTGKHFLKKAGDEQSKKLTRTLKKHAGRARA